MVRPTAWETVLEQKKEEWRPVEGYDGYFISSRGRFKHNKKILKVKKGYDGYMYCHILKRKFRVHRLVAKAFIPNPDNLPVVDHIDGCKTNNYVENLRWVTVSENTQSAYDMGLNPSGVRKDIIAVNPKEEAFVFESQVKAEEYTGVPRKEISKIVRGLVGSRYGWRFFRIISLHDFRVKRKTVS